MIEKQTLFILGAGASSSYGYPTGDELKKSIIKHFWEDFYNNILHNKGTGHLVSPDDVKDFCYALDKSDDFLIDYFLQTCDNDTFVHYGKLAVLYYILKAEFDTLRKLNCEFENDNWYPILFNKLTEGINNPESINLNKVSFITFNYDRFLEYRLTSSIKHKYSLDWDVAYKCRKDLKIHHVFGSLPLFHGAVTKSLSIENVQLHELQNMKKEIKTIHERTTIETAEIKKMINEAERIFFLGFGYNRENLNLLQINNNVVQDTKIFGTACGINKERLKSIQNQFTDIVNTTDKKPSLYLSLENMKCRELLEKYLIDPF